MTAQQTEADLPRYPVRLPPPCPICGEIEREVTAGIYRIQHDYSKHPGLEERPRQRLSTEELMEVPNPDFSAILDQNPRYSLGISETK